MRRRLAFALLAAVLLLAAAAWAVPAAVESALSRQGFTWSHRSGTRWHDLRREGISAESLTLTLSPTPGAVLSGVNIEIDDLRSPSTTTSAEVSTPPRSLPLHFWAEDLAVSWQGDELASGLSGELWPELSLGSTDSAISRDASGWSVQLRRPLEVGPLSGEALLTVTGDTRLQLDLSIPGAVVTHPVLADGPLPAQPLVAALVWDRTSGALSGEVSLGDVTVSVDGMLSTSSLSLTADLSADAIPLDAIIALFGRHIPEARRADIRGSVGLQASISGPPAVWSAEVTAERLAAGGVIGSLSQLKYGPFTWRAPAADQGEVLRQTGEGHRSWTPLRDGMLLAHAAIAAEDARFLSHPGYDIEGINAALAELSAGAERPRGGSTITQQLAKNLFLDGERTIARKLRELLLSLELERVLGKPRILELYINVVEFGPTLYGVRAAADAYFIKQPAGLAPQEAAFLAAILPSPRSWYARLVRGARPPEASVDRILQNMVNTGALDAELSRW
ncbi:MAG: hypothetical protein ACI8S6_005582, partial [Myxococcota bacterium]